MSGTQSFGRGKFSQAGRALVRGTRGHNRGRARGNASVPCKHTSSDGGMHEDDDDLNDIPECPSKNTLEKEHDRAKEKDFVPTKKKLDMDVESNQDRGALAC